MKNIANSERQLSDETFLSRAPAHGSREPSARSWPITKRSCEKLDVPMTQHRPPRARRRYRRGRRHHAAPACPKTSRARGTFHRARAAGPRRTEVLDEIFDRVVAAASAMATAAQRGEAIADGAMATPARLLERERVALNFLQRLSGVATLARQFADAVAGTGCRVLDTRKTTPGMRALEKRAAAAGGVTNHRMGLFDAILIKNNHIAAAGGVGGISGLTPPRAAPTATHPVGSAAHRNRSPHPRRTARSSRRRRRPPPARQPHSRRSRRVDPRNRRPRHGRTLRRHHARQPSAPTPKPAPISSPPAPSPTPPAPWISASGWNSYEPRFPSPRAARSPHRLLSVHRFHHARRRRPAARLGRSRR